VDSQGGVVAENVRGGWGVGRGVHWVR